MQKLLTTALHPPTSAVCHEQAVKG